MIMDDRALATPHSIVWEYYDCLKRQLVRIPSDKQDRTRKQEIALSLLLSVTVIECFLNVFFRVVVSENKYKSHEARFLKDIERRISLERKIKEWPKRILGHRLNYSNESISDFIQLKNHRNELMHFVSSHESIDLPGPIKINGLADMTPFEKLTLTEAVEYLQIIREFSYEIFRARGIDEDNLQHSFHLWFGEPPTNN